VKLEQSGIQTLYGDAEEPELALALPLSSARVVVSSIPVREINLALVHGLRLAGFEGPIVATAHHAAEVENLRDSGVDVVLEPFAAAAQHTTQQILDVVPPVRSERDEGP
jgi:Trk K+ transport system NAD-binding subunit